MVQRSEVMKAAEAKARRIVENARAEASRQRNEADDFCDKRLAQLETVLERTMTVIASGRAKLRGPAGEGLPPTAAVAGDAAEAAKVGAAGPADLDDDHAHRASSTRTAIIDHQVGRPRRRRRALAWSPCPSPSPSPRVTCSGTPGARHPVTLAGRLPGRRPVHDPRWPTTTSWPSWCSRRRAMP